MYYDIVLGDETGLFIVNKLKVFVLKKRIANKEKMKLILGKMHEKVMVMVNYVEKNILVSENN